MENYNRCRQCGQNLPTYQSDVDDSVRWLAVMDPEEGPICGDCLTHEERERFLPPEAVDLCRGEGWAAGGRSARLDAITGCALGTLPSRAGNPLNPQVGDAATFTVATDSYACTVAAVERGGAILVLRRDKATLLNGWESGASDSLRFTPGGFCGHTSGVQRYSYDQDPEGRLIRVGRRVLHDGTVIWKEVGHPTRSPGLSASLGFRAEHYDYNF
jgi:hypothetical protein